jgi:V/A-type H+-transporting ATPase subunit E
MNSSNGVEKIKNRIMTDSKALCDKILEDARLEARSIIENAEKEAFQKVTVMTEKAKEEAEQIKKRMQAVAELEERKRALKHRQNLIDKAFTLALDRITSLPEEEYSAFLERMLLKAAKEGRGEIRLSEKDKERLGKDFISRINKKLSKEGKKAELVMAEESLDSLGGFVLTYGDMEINCSLETLMNMARPGLESRVAEILFG